MASDERHSRHRLFPPIGDAGQRKLASARIAVVGCGALGSRIAELLARAGIASAPGGLLRIIDRDTVDVSNLQRQALFDSDDAAEARPKAQAARRHIAKIDPGVNLEAHVRDFSPLNAARFFQSIDLAIDGTDNFRTRFLINDAALAAGIPWIYGGAVASRGIAAAFVPGAGPCFRCLLGQVPGLGRGETCDTAGIITPLPTLVAALETALAMRWIVEGVLPRGIRTIDLWSPEMRWTTALETAGADPACRSCGTREFPALSEEGQELVTLCGRNSVQIVSPDGADLDLAQKRLEGIATSILRHPESLTARFHDGSLTLFDDGRILVEGTTDPHEATSMVARYLGG